MDLTRSSYFQLIVSVIFILDIPVATSEFPCSGEAVGHALYFRGSTLGRQSRDYLIRDGGRIQCTGVISEWRYFKESRLCDDVTFNVWRETSPDRYRLVGENEHDSSVCTGIAAASTEVTFRVPEHKRIPVQAGDIIGWTQTGAGFNGMIRGLPLDLVDGGFIRWRTACTNSNPGQICNFAQVSQNPGSLPFASASLQAVVIKGPPPTLDNLPNVLNISENLNPSARPQETRFEIGASHKMIHSGLYTNVWRNSFPMTVSLGQGEFARGQGLFQITTAGGRYYLQPRVALNYETGQQYVVPIVVEALAQRVTGNMTVNVLDMNEAHGVINLPARRSVSALGSPPDKEIFKVEVFDPDVYNPTKFYYSIRSFIATSRDARNRTFNDTRSAASFNDYVYPLYPFKMDVETGVISTSMDLIEYEYPGRTQVTFYLTLMAADGQHESQGLLTLTITNLRQPPIYVNLPDTVYLFENVPGPNHVYQVVASGTDLSRMRFSLITVAPVTKKGKFTIDEETGFVSLSTDPGFDFLDVDGTIFTLTISVTDGYLGAVQDNLYVSIGWTNKDPVYVANQYFITIPEKCGDTIWRCEDDPRAPQLPWWPAPDPTLPSAIFAVDRDVEANEPSPVDRLSCSILTALYSSYFDTPDALNCRSLLMTRQLDVNSDPAQVSINLTLRTTDSYGGAAIARVFITVYDINDHVPTFNPGSYRGEVNENTKGGLSLLTVSATDRDWNENAEITYSIIKTNDPFAGHIYFEVHPQTGVLTTKQPVDYEALPVNGKFISFQVEARDGGTPSRASAANVRIDILDVNDNHPEWQCVNRPEEDLYPPSDLCLYNTELRHDTLIGYEVLQIRATDVDTVSPNVSYYLLKPDMFFLVTHLSGEVLVKDDLQTYTKYVLYCYGEDNGLPNLLTTPQFVRIDTYPPTSHLIDIVLEVPSRNFNDSTTRQQFLQALRNVIEQDFGKVWVTKIENYKIDRDKFTVTIYALKDNSTFGLENLRLEKEFVHRNDLLGILRQDFWGKPSDAITGVNFTEWMPIEVSPAYPIFWIDTIPGLVTIGLLCLALIALIVGLTVGLCKYYRTCCFAEKDRPSSASRIMPHPGDPSFLKNDDQSLRRRRNRDERQTTFENPMYGKRRGSTDTVHSFIYPRVEKVDKF